MKQLISAAVVLAVTILLYSETASAVSVEVTISRISPTEDGMVYLIVAPELPYACSAASADNLRFDGKTPGGKAMYAMLLSAKLTNKKVAVWYTALASNLVGTKNCGTPELAVLSSVAIN